VCLDFSTICDISDFIRFAFHLSLSLFVNLFSSMMDKSLLKWFVVVVAGLAAVAWAAEEHSDPKEHKREGGKSKPARILKIKRCLKQFQTH
jgi:hypothetical protein